MQTASQRHLRHQNKLKKRRFLVPIAFVFLDASTTTTEKEEWK